MMNIAHQGDPCHWPEPDNNYLNTCSVCEVVFHGPKRARVCHVHRLEGLARQAEALAAYEEAHKDEQAEKFFPQSSVFMYRNGWTAGWIAAKYPAP